MQGAGIVCGCPSRRAELRPFSRARGPLGREYLVSTSRDPHLLGKRGDVGPCVDGHPVTSAASITANRYRTGGGPAHYKYQLTYTPKTDPNLDATTPCTEFPTVPRQPPYTLCLPGYPPRTCTLPFAGDLACFTYLLTHRATSSHHSSHTPRLLFGLIRRHQFTGKMSVPGVLMAPSLRPSLST